MATPATFWAVMLPCRYMGFDFTAQMGTWNRNHKYVLFVTALICHKRSFVMPDYFPAATFLKNLQQSSVFWDCLHESLSKSSLLMPNSLICCWLLFIQLKHIILVTCGTCNLLLLLLYSVCLLKLDNWYACNCLGLTDIGAHRVRPRHPDNSLAFKTASALA